MSDLGIFLNHNTIESVGWALVHSVWQIALLAAIHAASRYFLRKHSASIRYALACVALATMAVVPVATAWAVWAYHAKQTTTAEIAKKPLSKEATQPVAIGKQGKDTITIASEVAGQEQIEGRGESTSGATRPFEAQGVTPIAVTSMFDAVNNNLPWLVAAWLLGVAVFSARLACGCWGTRRLRREAIAPLGESLQQRLSRLADRLGVRRAVRLVESALIEAPSVIGHFRPVILLPTAMLTGLTPRQVEAILAHELAHIRRHDYLINLVQSAIETIYFYHPALWWVSREIRQERENCCDDLALTVCADRAAYARALATMEELRSGKYRPAVAASGGSLLARVRRIVGCPTEGPSRRHAWLVGMLLLGVVLATTLGVMGVSSGIAEDKATPAIKTETEGHTDGKSVQSHTISGQVTDSDGRPIDGALVEWGYILDPPDRWQRTETDEQGRYRLDLKSHGVGYRLGVSAEGMAPQWQVFYSTWNYIPKIPITDEVAVPPEKVDFKLEPGHYLKGIVVDEQGRPIAGAKIKATTAVEGFYSSFSMPSQSMSIPGQGKFTATTDASGHFALDGLPAEHVQLRVTSPHRHVNDGNYTVDNQQRIKMSGSGRPGVIRGQVIDRKTLKPVQDFQVTLRHVPKSCAFHSEDGRFNWPDKVTKGNAYETHVYAKGYAPKKIKIVAGGINDGMPTPIKLQSAPAFLGRLVDAQTGRPLADVPVLYGVADKGSNVFEWKRLDQMVDGSGAFTSVQRAVTDERGEFWFCEAENGSKGTLFILTEGYGRVVLLPEERPSVAKGQPVQIELLPEAVISGTLQENGRPVLNGEIQVWKVSQQPEIIEQWLESVRTDPQGFYRIGNLAPGTYRVTRAVWPNRQMTTFETLDTVALDAGEHNVFGPHASEKPEKDAESKKASLTINYHILDDEPTGLFLLVQKTSGNKGQAHAKEAQIKVRNGIPRQFKNLPPGVYELARYKPTKNVDPRTKPGVRVYPCGQRDIELKPDKETKVDFTRGKDAKPITGRVTGLPNEDYPYSLTVVVRSPKATGRPQSAEEDSLPNYDAIACWPGKLFKTAPIPPGEYTLVAEAHRAPIDDEKWWPDYKEMWRWDLNEFRGAARVTVPADGDVPEVEIKMAPRPNFKPLENNAEANTPSSSKAATLVIRYDMPGDEAEAKFHIQGITKDNNGMPVKNGEQVTIKDLKPGERQLLRLKTAEMLDPRMNLGGKTFLLDRRNVQLKGGETTTVNFVRRGGRPITGKVTGLPNDSPYALQVEVRSPKATGNPHSSKDVMLPTYDGLACRPGKLFTTGPIPPGEYTLVAEAYRPLKKPSMTGWILPDFLGTAKVTVPSEGDVPEVEIKMLPLKEFEQRIKKNDSAWGKPVDGVRVRAHVSKHVWRYGAGNAQGNKGNLPEVQVWVDIRDPKMFEDRKKEKRAFNSDPSSFSLEIDGKIYTNSTIYHGRTRGFDIHSFKTRFALDDSWRHGRNVDANGRFRLGTPLTWTPGKHTVRVLFTELGQDPAPASVPFEIEILPPQLKLGPWAAPWSEPVRDLQTSAMAKKPVCPEGSDPVLRVRVRNMGKEKHAIHLRPQAFSIYIDGQRYINRVVCPTWRMPFEQGDEYETLVRLDGHWQEEGNNGAGSPPSDPWRKTDGIGPYCKYLAPGKHQIRVMLTDLGSTNNPITPPVEIEIIAKDEKVSTPNNSAPLADNFLDESSRERFADMLKHLNASEGKSSATEAKEPPSSEPDQLPRAETQQKIAPAVAKSLGKTVQAQLAGSTASTIANGMGQAIEGTVATVRVLDEKGRPLKKRIKIHSSYSTPSFTLCNCDGTSVNLDKHFSEEGRLGFTVLATGFLPKEVDIPIKKGERPKFDVQLERGGTVRGRVLDHDGKPVQGAGVVLRGYDALPIRVVHGELLAHCKNIYDELIVHNEQVLDIDYQMARTDADGRFEASGWNNETEGILVIAPSRVTAWAVASPKKTDEEVVIRLPKPGALKVVLDIPGVESEPENPKESKNCKTVCINLCFNEMIGDFMESISVDIEHVCDLENPGKVIIPNLTPGTYQIGREKTLQLGKHTYSMNCDSQEITIKSGETKTVRMVRRRGQRVTGSLVGLPKAVPGARITVCSPKTSDNPYEADINPCYAMVKSNPDGSFATPLLEPGKYKILVEADRDKTSLTQYSLPNRSPDSDLIASMRDSMPDYVGAAVVEVKDALPDSTEPGPVVRIEMRPFDKDAQVKKYQEKRKRSQEALKKMSGQFEFEEGFDLEQLEREQTKQLLHRGP